GTICRIRPRPGRRRSDTPEGPARPAARWHAQRSARMREPRPWFSLSDLSLLLHSLLHLPLAQMHEFLWGNAPVPVGIDPPELLCEERKPARLLQRQKPVTVGVRGAEQRQAFRAHPADVRIARARPLDPLPRRTLALRPV